MGFDEGGLDEIAAEFAATLNDFAALVANVVEGAKHGIDRCAIDEGTHESGFVEGVADADLLVGELQHGSELRCDAALEEEAAGGSAALPGGADCAKEYGAKGEIEVGIVHDDEA